MIGIIELTLIIIIVILGLKLWNIKKDSVEQKKTILSKYDSNQDKYICISKLKLILKCSKKKNIE